MTERLAYSPAAVKRAAELLREGRLVAFPTETVYGLGARADRADAVRAIFTAKGRPSTNPLIVHVPDIALARDLAADWPAAAARLAAAFWPGPLTLVVPRRLTASSTAVFPPLPHEVTAGGPTVALRVPAHPVARDLLTAAQLPLAAPSANRSTSISPTTADHVLKTLEGRVDLVLDGGPTGYGIESTIVDVSREPAVLLRHGAIPLAALQALIPIVDHGAAIVAEGEIARAPGGLARHYAPRARVLLLPPSTASNEVHAARARGETCGLLTFTPDPISPPIERLPADPEGYAAGLYAALHRLEDAGCATIVIAEPPDLPAWAAVRDRLRRASA